MSSITEQGNSPQVA